MFKNFQCVKQPLQEQLITYVQRLCNFFVYSTIFVATLGISYFVVNNSRFRRIFYPLSRSIYSKVRGNILIVNNKEECILAVHELRRKCCDLRVLGMDCEWCSDGETSKKKVALLQLASVDGFCSLFRLCNIGCVPDCLSELLGDKTILKTGVAVSNDAGRLFQDYGAECLSCLDVRFMAKHVGLAALGLAKMSEMYLDVKLDKHWRIRCSNWEADELSDKQILYAANDALMSVYLFQFFNNKYVKSTYPWWKRLFWTNKQLWYNSEHCWFDYIDRGFSDKAYSHHIQNEKPKVGSSSTGRPMKNARSYSTHPHTARKSPLYHNIFLQAPDGEVLCTCDERKINWFLNRELAYVVCDDPLTVRLKFEPSGRRGGGEGYYAKVKNNICAVCGSTKSLRRKNVVPHEYRKYFPVKVKEHSSHDVLLLCEFCHYKSNYHDRQLKCRLADQCNAPLSQSNEKVSRLKDMLKVKSAARALLNNGDNIPERRKKELESILLDYLFVNDSTYYMDDKNDTDFNNITNCVSADISYGCILNRDKLEELSTVKTQVENKKYQPHGQSVVEYFKLKLNKEEDGVNELEQLWRSHFVKCMSPRFLPELWSIDYIHF